MTTSETTRFGLEDEVGIIGGFPHYDRRIGRVEALSSLDGRPYYGIRLSGVGHLVWCFEEWLRDV